MSGRIPENILEDILSRTDIVELIAGYIPLKKSGRNFRANCPFHREKTPSFMVSQDKQIYHCFGCGAGGNAFNFLVQYERLEFPEAVELLAKRAGIVLAESQKQDDKAASLTTQLYKANELAMLFYQQQLNSAPGKQAQEYLLKRGLKESAISLFKLGLAADTWDSLLNYLRNKNISISILEKAGLIIPKKGAGFYDRFRSRIIFPILDIRSRGIGFGGRVLDDGLPKYINSPETFIYTKGNNLYGLNLSKDAIRDSDYAVIVEGYLDFILPFQEGLKNIAASLGTALTQEQARLIKRYTHNVVLIYDPDTAGEAATLRSLDIFVEEDMDVRVVTLPQGMDPDLFVRKSGIEALREKIKEADHLFDYKLKILKAHYSGSGIEAKANIAAEMLATIKKFKNAVLRSGYLKQLAEDLRLKEEVLLEEMGKIRGERHYQQSASLQDKHSDINPTEKLLINLMLEETDVLSRIKSELKPQDFQSDMASRIVSIMFGLFEQGKAVELHKLLNQVEDGAVLQAICGSALSCEMSAENKERAIAECVRRIKAKKLELKKQQLQEEITNAEKTNNEEKLDSLKHEFNSLTKK